MSTLASSVAASTLNAGKQDFSVERRRKTRTPVHWTLRFWGGTLAETIETVTQDLSSDGFYCFSRIPFIPGEQLICMLRIPEHHLDRSDRATELECQVKVVRVDPVREEGYFGIGCKIEDYRLTTMALPSVKR